MPKPLGDARATPHPLDDGPSTSLGPADVDDIALAPGRIRLLELGFRELEKTIRETLVVGIAQLTTEVRSGRSEIATTMAEVHKVADRQDLVEAQLRKLSLAVARVVKLTKPVVKVKAKPSKTKSAKPRQNVR
jgi:hypothetical protein